jgi:23S rRNA pseudouridine1911/1915/1917 synthase
MRWDRNNRVQRAGNERDGRAVLARASFRVVRRFGWRATVLEVQLQTGRRNQVRLHCELDGYPLIGERQYVGKDAPPPPVRAPRQALHALRLGFKHPATGRAVEYESPLPPDLEARLAKLRG